MVDCNPGTFPAAYEDSKCNNAAKLLDPFSKLLLIELYYFVVEICILISSLRSSKHAAERVLSFRQVLVSRLGRVEFFECRVLKQGSPSRDEKLS